MLIMNTALLPLARVADLLGVSKETLRRWDRSGKLVSVRHPINGYRMYRESDLQKFEEIGLLNVTERDSAVGVIAQAGTQEFATIELFAGAGGLAIGLEEAGLHCKLLSEIDKDACATLIRNRPDWNVIEGDVAKIDFAPYQGHIDVVTGGFPCQAFSYAGKKLGLEDARGTLFYEFARAVKEVQPLIAVGENVRGLISHENGRTLAGMTSILNDLGYTVLDPRVLRAIFYDVPQKRERLFIVALRSDFAGSFEFPKPKDYVLNLKDALKAGVLYPTDVPESPGQIYPIRKRQILDLVPPGGYWRDLPEDIQREYMQKSFFLGGGKTGMARRIAWDEPSLTLTCAPAQKQTERCHPDETRPFTVREYARIQTFPDEWEFSGSVSSQYKQIGNAVPVNLARAVGQSVASALKSHYTSASS